LKLIDFQISRNQNGQTTVILMPFFPKGTLHSLLEANRAMNKPKYLSEPDILKMFLSVCNGVKEFHKRNPPLSHNDIKPGNLLLAPQSQLVLFDFGSVTPARHSITSRKEAVQLQEWSEANMTALYKAPELFDVANDATIDERTDIWALGCTLYAMCFNFSPFESGATNGSIALAVTSGKIDIPNGAEKRLSKRLLQFMLMMLNFDHRKRPSIEEVIQEVSILIQDKEENVLSIEINN